MLYRTVRRLFCAPFVHPFVHCVVVLKYICVYVDHVYVYVTFCYKLIYVLLSDKIAHLKYTESRYIASFHL